jgi:hypothetical protein
VTGELDTILKQYLSSRLCYNFTGTEKIMDGKDTYDVKVTKCNTAELIECKQLKRLNMFQRIIETLTGRKYGK